MSQLDLPWADHARNGPDQGVWLGRLLELTRPTPTQAVVIGLGVVCGVRAVHATGCAHGRVCAGAVRVGEDGQARLVGWAAQTVPGPEEPVEQRRRADVAALGVLLADLAGAARRSPPATDANALAILAALDAAAHCAALPDTDVELVAGPLEVACGPDQKAAARSELAALVAAATASGPTPTSDPSQSARTAASSAPPDSSRAWWVARLGAGVRFGWKRTWPWAVALAVLVGTVSLEFVVLRDRLNQDVRLLLDGTRPGRDTDSQAGSTPVVLPSIPSPAPASAGAVAGLDLRALEPCAPGGLCAVRVLVRLQPQPQRQEVVWTFQVVDRCTGSQRSLPGGVLSVAPGGDQAQAVSTVPLPPGRALGVVAVTSEPASAASRPLLIPIRQGSC